MSDSSGPSLSVREANHRRSLRLDSATEEGFLEFFLEVLSFWTVIFYTPSSEVVSLELPKSTFEGVVPVDDEGEDRGEIELNATEQDELA